jgi:sugar O-acyltransferase (sialic acid O-acetyltransferase NeuD family)
VMYLVGAGGFGRETLDALLATLGAPLDPTSGTVAFLDEGLSGQQVRGLPVHPMDHPARGDHVVVAIAAPAVRRRLAGVCSAAGLVPRTVVHPASVIGPETTLGQGCVVLALAHVSSSVTIGDHVQINYNVSIGHDCVLADFVTVLPGANVSGAVRLEEGATVGAGAVVLPGLTVGAGAMIGAGAVVTKDVAPGRTVKGVPAS